MRYKKTIRHVILITSILFIFCNKIYPASYNILILNSYHKNLSWSESVINGIESGLKEYIDKPYELHIEYLDSKRHWNEKYIESFTQLMQTKYEGVEFDLVFANDDNAMNFLLNNKKRVFPKSPVITTGINFSHKYPTNYTGLTEKIDFCANLELIKDLHPETEHLYVIADNTKTGKLIKRNISNAIKNNSCNFEYTFLENYTLNELTERLKSLTKNDVVFLTTFNRDKNGRYYSYSEIIENISKETSIPIYAPWNFYLGKGIVGGKIINGFDNGKLAAKKCADILKDRKTPHEIPIIPSPSKYEFDYNQLKRYDISLNELPENSTIINNPYDKVEENLNIIIFTITLIVLLLTLIFILLRYNRIKKQRILEQKGHLEELNKINKTLETEKQKAEKANSLKSKFLANISHEIRTPLNAIIGFSRLITDDNHIEKDEQERYHNLIRINGEVLLNLIHDIIDLSKIETNQLKVSYSNFDLNKLISDIYEYGIQRIKESKKKDLKLNPEKAIKREKFIIYSDEDRLRQVLINLLNNAIKFSYFGTVTFGYQINGEHILFYFKDPGIGIDKEELNHIFEKFRKADEENASNTEGAGLGLSVSKGIIENMQGKIWIDSQKNKGTTVYFTIPLIPTSEAEKTKKKTVKFENNNQYDWSHKNILIVEDSKMAYELIKKLLRGTNATFQLEMDGKSAIERCTKDPSIDLVLMDIQLPMIDGYSATRQIKEKRADLPIIAQTANAMSDDRKKAFDAGCDEYIAKPLDREELTNKINKLLVRESKA
jgi:signal transduction histidine kinase/ActR/RegA family two-component response regulator